VTGKSGAGDFRKEIGMDTSPPVSVDGYGTLSYLWARKRIAGLADFNSFRGDDENRAEITSLGLTYNLLTRFTSFVAVQDVVRNPESPARDVDQPLPLPKHVSPLAVGGTVASMPEPELYVVGIALAALLILGRGFRKSGTSGRGNGMDRNRS